MLAKSDSHPKKIVIVSGSIRSGSLTTAASQIMADECERLGCITETITMTGRIDPSSEEWFEGDVLSHFQDTVSRADAVILCTPEYNGTFSAVMKIFIEAIGFPSPLSEKMVSLVGVASGVIGAVKALEHLRCVVAHCGGYVMPFALSIKEAHLVLNSGGVPSDPQTIISLRESVKNLVEALPKSPLS